MTQQALQPALAAGRTAVITGAASGIGLAAAQRFAALGMRVCLADVDARVRWTADDITQNRPPLSRWHPDWAEAFRAYAGS